MEYRAFGRTGLQVSALGFGCWEIGGGYGDIESEQFHRAVSRALELGVNCFDTAEAYGFGASERELGKALGSRRGDAIVVTKFGVGYPDAPEYRDASPDRLTKSLESSLQHLGSDYIDVYLVHWPDRNTPFDATMRALEDAEQSGKVRFVGVSNHRPSQLEACMGTRRIDVAQYCWSLFDRRMGRDVLPFCARHEIGVMAYAPLAYGLLTGTLTEETAFAKDDWRGRGGRLGTINLARTLFGPEHFGRNVAAVTELGKLAEARGLTLPQFALRWVLSNPTISVALMGCRRPEEVDDNVGAVGETLSETDMAEIDAVFERHGIDTSPGTWIEDDGLDA